MPHHVYHTRALVMKARSSGESDSTLELFTKDWGRITAHARGLRKESSRLRFILQPMSWGNVCVVRGAGGWRLTTANPDEPGMDFKKGRSSLSRVSRVVERFIPQEVPSLFAFEALRRHTQMLCRDYAHASDWEMMTLARLFEYLGYWGIERVDESVSMATYTPERKARIVSEINRILRTSHS